VLWKEKKVNGRLKLNCLEINIIKNRKLQSIIRIKLTDFPFIKETQMIRKRKFIDCLKKIKYKKTLWEI
jgi:hypothetical protein